MKKGIQRAVAAVLVAAAAIQILSLAAAKPKDKK